MSSISNGLWTTADANCVQLGPIYQSDPSISRTHLSEGTYPKCINDSYYAVFYAAKVGLGWLGIRTKGH